MDKKAYFGIIIVLIVGFGFWYFSGTSEQDPKPNERQNEEDLSSEGGHEFHNVSLPALMQAEFTGSDFTVGRVLDDNQAYTRYYITYKSSRSDQSDELTISGIMNVPKGEGPFPVLVLNHGYIDPAVYTNGRGLKREQDYLARRGYVVVHPDYRNHADSTKDADAEFELRLGYVEDVINAVRAMENSGLSYIDTERVGMLGHSMGGGVTLNILVVKPDLVDAAVLFAPVSGDQRENFDRWTERRTETAERILQAYGSPNENPEFWDDVSANTFYQRIETPIMIHHGTADESVPLSWSERLDRELNDAGQDPIFYIYDDEPHEFILAWPDVMQRTANFFDEHLKSEF